MENNCNHEWVEGTRMVGMMFWPNFIDYTTNESGVVEPDELELWSKNRICQLCKKEQVWIERGVFPQSTDGWL